MTMTTTESSNHSHSWIDAYQANAKALIRMARQVIFKARFQPSLSSHDINNQVNHLALFPIHKDE
jgi:hypothetical protein